MLVATLAMLFICEGRIGLCYVFVVLPSCIALVSIINRDVDACKCGECCRGT